MIAQKYMKRPQSTLAHEDHFVFSYAKKGDQRIPDRGICHDKLKRFEQSRIILFLQKLIFKCSRSQDILIGQSSGLLRLQTEFFMVAKKDEDGQKIVEPDISELAEEIRTEFFTRRSAYEIIIEIGKNELAQLAQLQKMIKIYEFQIFLTQNQMILSNMREKNEKKQIQQRQTENFLNNQPILPIDNIIFRIEGIPTWERQKIKEILEEYKRKSLVVKPKQQMYQESEIKQVFELQFTNQSETVEFLIKLKNLQFLHLLQFNSSLKDKYRKDSIQCQILVDQNSEKGFFKNINKVLEEGDLFAIRSIWNFWTPTRIQSIFWCLEIDYLKQELILLGFLLQQQISTFTFNNFSIFELFCPGAKRLLKMLDKEFQYLNFDKKINFSKTKSESENIICLYVEQKMKRVEKGPNFKIQISTQGGRKSLSQYISLKKHHLPKQFYNILELIDQYFRQNKEMQSEKDANQAFFLDNIEQQKIPNAKYPCCSSFFYMNMNIQDFSSSCIPLKVFKSLDKIYEYEIKYQICSMLNSGGGVVLFGCQLKALEIMIKQQIFTEQDKQIWEQRLKSYLKMFQPQIEMMKNIKVDFVPVFQNPLDNYHDYQYIIQEHEDCQYMKSKNKKILRQRNHIPGSFALRVKVIPVDPSQTYIFCLNTEEFKDQKEKEWLCSKREGNKPKLLSGKEIAKHIKRKMKTCYLSSKLTEKQKILSRKNMTFFNHKCETSIENVFHNVQRYPDYHQYFLSDEQPIYSMIIVEQKQDFKVVKKHFNKMNFALTREWNDIVNAKIIGLIYHGCSFKKLQNKISCIPSRELNTKPEVFLITNFIQIRTDYYFQQRPIDLQIFNEVISKIPSEFADETISYYEIKTQGIREKQYYLECYSNQANFYAYIFLRQTGYSVVFKDPINFYRVRNRQEISNETILFERKGLLNSYHMRE